MGSWSPKSVKGHHEAKNTKKKPAARSQQSRIVALLFLVALVPTLYEDETLMRLLAHPTALKDSNNNKLRQSKQPTHNNGGGSARERQVGHNIPRNPPPARNLHVALVGDSLIHWQYLSLVTFLHTGSWWWGDCSTTTTSATWNASACGGEGIPQSAAEWNDFYQASNSLLHGYEVCDCYREEESNVSGGPTTTAHSPSSRIRFSHLFQNRYYRNAEYNISVTYLAKFGRHPMQGRLLPGKKQETTERGGGHNGTTANLLSFLSHTMTMIKTASNPRRSSLNKSVKVAWQGNWMEVIPSHLSLLTPPPQFVIFNAGGDPHDLDAFTVETMNQTLRSYSMQGVYQKTTLLPHNATMGNVRFNASLADREEDYCRRILGYCLDMTKHRFAPQLYRDSEPYLHPRVYQLINEDLLQSIIDVRATEQLAFPIEHGPARPNATQPLTLPLPQHQRPTNLSVMFIGDSLTRYQYVSLVYFLHTGQWVNDSQTPSLTYRPQFPAWKEYFEASNQALGGKEICDCFRKRYHRFEDRFYYDPIRNNQVSFLLKFGVENARGHYYPANVTAAQRNLSGIVLPPLPLVYEYIPAVWLASWLDLLQTLVAEMNPRPRYLIINAGAWASDLNIPMIQQIRSVLDNLGVQGIYKMSTRHQDGTENDFVGPEARICELLHFCYSLPRWPRAPDYYMDTQHFTSSVYQRLNENLLHLLDAIDSGIVVPNPIR